MKAALRYVKAKLSALKCLIKETVDRQIRFSAINVFKVIVVTFFFISQNVAICPKTFSNRVDSHY